MGFDQFIRGKLKSPSNIIYGNGAGIVNIYCGHSQEDEGSLDDAESISDTLAYEGGICQKYVKKEEEVSTKMVGSICV